MSIQGSITTSDFLDFDSTMVKSMKILKTDNQNFKIAFLTILGINVGLRISDLLKLKHSDFQNEEIALIERKTNKRRIIRLNDNVKNAYSLFCNRLKVFHNDDFIFKSQKKCVFTVRQINRLMKPIYGAKGKNISSHSLRKTFGRRVWANDNFSERALIMLSKLFNHSSISTTKIYLGIHQEELNDIYLNL